MWHGRAPHSDGEPLLELDEAQLVDALRDGVTEQLASCSASLLVVWDAGGALAPSVVASALAPLTKSQHSGPPVLLLMPRDRDAVDPPRVAQRPSADRASEPRAARMVLIFPSATLPSAPRAVVGLGKGRSALILFKLCNQPDHRNSYSSVEQKISHIIA